MVFMFCLFNSHPECSASVRLSSYRLENGNASQVKLLIKALLKCQKQLYCIEESISKKIDNPVMKICVGAVMPFPSYTIDDFHMVICHIELVHFKDRLHSERKSVFWKMFQYIDLVF